MNVTSKISVDMTRPNMGTWVNAVQGDGNTRQVEIALLSGGAPWTPPDGVEAAIAYYQLGGVKGLYNLLADGSAAISISGNVATIVLAPQMLTASGTVQASLVFNDQKLNRLTTFPFSVFVESNPAAGAQKVEDYLRLQWLEDKLDEYLRKAADSGEFDGKPGDNGVTFTPSVSENGDLIWRNNGGLPNPQTVNIQGPQGDSTAASAAANAAQTSAANAETHASDAAASAAAAKEAVDAMGTELGHIKDDLSDKLPKSPANWEAWTAEEQASAREQMGIPGDYELIEEITLEEDVGSISRSNEPDGTPYRFSAFCIIAEINISDSDTSSYMRVDASTDSTPNLFLELFYRPSIKNKRIHVNYEALSPKIFRLSSEINDIGSVWFARGNVSVRNLAYGDGPITSTIVNNIRISDITLCAGSKVTIYGVRA